ncbi:MAG TPA: hypothetical protein DCQ83_04105 [Fibrobacteres bacterium]|jgi:hypothetical protein|nr:hypothetical protein [Fibrobacterota bacterium]
MYAKQAIYRNYNTAKATKQMSEHIVIRERDYTATLYFNSASRFYGYIVYAPLRPIGDEGIRDDLSELSNFMGSKYGKPLTKKGQVVLPERAGEKFEYETWRLQGFEVKVSIICDGRNIWVQESVRNRNLSD